MDQSLSYGRTLSHQNAGQMVGRMVGQIRRGCAMSLTVEGVEAKREPGMYGDGGGLYLRVGPTGTKS